MNKIEELEAQLATFQDQIAELSSVKESYAQLQTLFAEKETALSEALAQLAQAQEAEAQVKLNARKAALSEVVAQDKVEGLMASLSSLDDDNFQAVVDSFGATKQALEQSDLMNEVGADSDDVTADAQEQVDPVLAATLAAIKNQQRR